jgi:hypothetical protein
MLQQAHVAAGAYRLTIWTAPARLRTGEIHIETIVYDGNGNLDNKCLVRVALTPLDGSGAGAPSGPSALAYPMSGALREAAFHVPHPGRYRVEATVFDETGKGASQGGQPLGAVAFEIEVTQVSPLVHFFIYLLLGASILAGAWMLRQGFAIWFDQRTGAGYAR